MYTEIEQLRKDLKKMCDEGWKHWQMAELTGLAQTTISSFLRGGTPSVRTFAELDCFVKEHANDK